MKVLSLITFDVKSAFNGVAIDILIQRLQKRCIPKQMVALIKNFCEDQKVTVIVNGETLRIVPLA